MKDETWAVASPKRDGPHESQRLQVDDFGELPYDPTHGAVPKRLRERSAKPRFGGSSPPRASSSFTLTRSYLGKIIPRPHKSTLALSRNTWPLATPARTPSHARSSSGLDTTQCRHGRDERTTTPERAENWIRRRRRVNSSWRRSTSELTCFDRPGRGRASFLLPRTAILPIRRCPKLQAKRSGVCSDTSSRFPKINGSRRC